MTETRGAAVLAAADGSVPDPSSDADRPSCGAMHSVVDQIGARRLWDRGITGDGVTVAVIDTGVAPVGALSEDGKVVGVVDLTADASDPSTAFVDTDGHGTHMAGIIAGRTPGADPARAADRPEWFLGVAPGARIVSVKVADQGGEVDLAAVVSGVEWVVAHADQLGIGVLSLAYSSNSPLPYEHDPLTAALEHAWNAGIVVVTPAGNDGPDSERLASPAVDPFVIAVAGADVSAEGVSIADFASRGDADRTPDFAAPGAHIESLRVPGSTADLDHPEGYVDETTFLGSGSSQAAAVAAGAAALLLDARPQLTPDQVKALLVSTADEIDSASSARAGSGLLNLERALSTEVGPAVQPWAPATFRGPVPIVPGVANIWRGAKAAGASWAGASWAGASWAGASWAGASWAGASWAGASWAGASWAQDSWAGASWAGASWAGASWAQDSWAGASWAGASWAGASWAGASWAGSYWA